MEMDQILKKIFLENFGKAYTASKLKDIVYNETGHYPRAAQFQRAFMQVRMESKLWTTPILRIMTNGQYRYVRSNNKLMVANHNSNLKREQINSEIKKIKQ